MTDKPSVKIITLGCAKNLVDSEEIAGVLDSNGWRVDASSRKHDVIIINTCGFLQSAAAESVRVIKQAVREKKTGRVKKVIVAGCLSQRLGAELVRLAPGADMYVGVGQMGRFHELAEKALGSREMLIEHDPPHHRWADAGTRAITGSPGSAYLKISEGCSHQCSFCTIPSFRGGHVSKPLERVVQEARILAKQGIREVNLIAQDVTQYGYDLYRKFTLPRLLAELNGIDGLDWIRMLYFYPNRLTDEVIQAMVKLPKVLPYIDIPLQHAHPDVLRRMKRPWDGDRYLRLFEKLRAALPSAAIRTTFIVGFPGETEDQFEYLVQFVQQARLDRVGAFKYSAETGTPSSTMENQISEKEKNRRFERLMTVQQPISLDINRSKIGACFDVLVEEVRDGWTAGRSYRDAPEIDGLVFAPGSAQSGGMLQVKITGAETYDLYGEFSRAGVDRSLIPLRVTTGAAPL